MNAPRPPANDCIIGSADVRATKCARIMRLPPQLALPGARAGDRTLRAHCELSRPLFVGRSTSLISVGFPRPRRRQAAVATFVCNTYRSNLKGSSV